MHVLTGDTPSTSNISKRLPEGLKKIDYYETVVDVLEGVATEETSGLVLSSERPVSTDYFNYHVLVFTCTISRKIGRLRKFIDGIIEKIPISGKIKQKLFDILLYIFDKNSYYFRFVSAFYLFLYLILYLSICWLKICLFQSIK
ncbi:MAG: hypothetical protein LBH92_01930 [Bacteroidales bacterium]|nr:hypothetical protein [Bacteroidales bacterium]